MTDDELAPTNRPRSIPPPAAIRAATVNRLRWLANAIEAGEVELRTVDSANQTVRSSDKDRERGIVKVGRTTLRITYHQDIVERPTPAP